MTDLPPPHPGQKKLGLVIDLDICVGCHACATACKEWNTGGHMAPLPDFNPYGDDAWGVWFNRIHSFEEGEGDGARTVHFPKSCLHCEEPACVTVCPTGASYKRAEDGIVLVNDDHLHRLQAVLLGLPLWRARVRRGCRGDEEMHAVHRPHLQREPAPRRARSRPASWSARPTPGISAISATPNSAVSELVAERGGGDLMPELGYRPVNKYLPPRRGTHGAAPLDRRRRSPRPSREAGGNRLLRWVDRLLSR